MSSIWSKTDIFDVFAGVGAGTGACAFKRKCVFGRVATAFGNGSRVALLTGRRGTNLFGAILSTDVSCTTVFEVLREVSRIEGAGRFDGMDAAGKNESRTAAPGSRLP